MNDDQLPRLELANSTGRTGFGDHEGLTGREAAPKELPGTDWTITGDGTVTSHRRRLMWVQGTWGQTWDGERFSGQSIKLSWNDATPLFGKGVFAYPDRTSFSIDPETWSDADIEHGYVRGSCTVTFAGYSDWRLPTVSEACLFVGERDEDLIKQLFPLDRVQAFLTASGKVSHFNPFKLRRCAGGVWKGWLHHCPNDENPDIAYPIIFCRNL